MQSPQVQKFSRRVMKEDMYVLVHGELDVAVAMGVGTRGTVVLGSENRL